MRPDQIDLNKLEVFFSVVEEGGVAGAARSLGRTPSAVSQAISRLEDSLGQTLFDRVGGRLVLSRGGQILHERFAIYRDALVRVLDEVANEEGEVRGTLRVGLFLGFPRARFATFVSHFARRYPAASVRVFYGSGDQLVQRLAAGRLDFAFSFRPEGVPPGLDATKLFERELVLVSGKRYFRAGFDRDELLQTPIIDYYKGDPLIDRWCAWHLGERGARPVPKVFAATTDLVLELVLEHAGAAILPLDLVATSRARLRVLRPSRRRLVDHLWLLERAGTFRDVTRTAFRDAVLEDFRQGRG